MYEEPFGVSKSHNAKNIMLTKRKAAYVCAFNFKQPNLNNSSGTNSSGTNYSC